MRRYLKGTNGTILTSDGCERSRTGEELPRTGSNLWPGDTLQISLDL